MLLLCDHNEAKFIGLPVRTQSDLHHSVQGSSFGVSQNSHFSDYRGVMQSAVVILTGFHYRRKIIFGHEEQHACV